MALSYNLGYQESISVHPTRRQNFAGKPYSNFPNIWEWLIFEARYDIFFDMLKSPIYRHSIISRYDKLIPDSIIKSLNAPVVVEEVKIDEEVESSFGREGVEEKTRDWSPNVETEIRDTRNW